MTELEKKLTPEIFERDQIISIIHEKLGEVRSALKAPIGRMYAEHFLDAAFEIADKLKCDMEIIGSRGNGTAKPYSDFDITLVPRSSDTPSKLKARLKKYLQSLDAKTTFKSGVNIEAGREYCAYNLDLDGHIALVTPIDSLNKGHTASMRMVAMTTKYPWKGYEENATSHDTVIDFGFAVYEDKRWIKPREFDPTQKRVIRMVDRNTFEAIPTSPTFNPENIYKLSRKSQAILSIRSFAAGEPIPDVDLTSFNAVTGEDEYVFIYNLCPSLAKVERNIGVKALTDEVFVEKILKFTFPYMYNLLKSINVGKDELKELFETIKRKYHLGDNGLFLQVLSLTAQHLIAEEDPRSGAKRDEAIKIGKVIENGLYSYDINRAAFMYIFTGTNAN